MLLLRKCLNFRTPGYFGGFYREYVTDLRSDNETRDSIEFRMFTVEKINKYEANRSNPLNSLPVEPPHIVMIDDDPDDLKMFSSEFEKRGIGVHTFDKSSDALNYFGLLPAKNRLPSVVIIDYNMPGMSGYDVLHLLKSSPHTCNIPVIMYSTNMDGELMLKLTGAGALACFNKPWNYKEFIKQVEIFQELASSFIPLNAYPVVREMPSTPSRVSNDRRGIS